MSQHFLSPSNCARSAQKVDSHRYCPPGLQGEEEEEEEDEEEGVGLVHGVSWCPSCPCLQQLP